MKRIFLALAGFVTLFGLMAAPVQSVVAPHPPQTEARPESKTFTGTILKSGESFVLSDSATKSSYIFDDQDKGSRFEGEHVKVAGTIDVASNMVHVETIEEIV